MVEMMTTMKTNNKDGARSRSKYQFLAKSQKEEFEKVEKLSLDEQRKRNVEQRAKQKQLEKEENIKKDEEQAKLQAKVIQKMLKELDDD